MECTKPKKLLTTNGASLHILQRLSQSLTSGIPSLSPQGRPTTKPASHCQALHHSLHQIWQLVPVAKPCSALPLPWFNWMFSGVVTKITCDPPLLLTLSCLPTLYTHYQISPRNHVLTHHCTNNFDSIIHFQ